MKDKLKIVINMSRQEYNETKLTYEDSKPVSARIVGRSCPSLDAFRQFGLIVGSIESTSIDLNREANI